MKAASAHSVPPGANVGQYPDTGMRYLPVYLLIVACAGFGFAYWGLETPDGRRAYDEMAGIIPMAAGLAGAVLVVVAAAIWLWRWISARHRSNPRKERT